MSSLAFNDAVRGVVAVAVASAMAAGGSACGAGGDQASVPAPDFSPDRMLVNGTDPAFADERTFACDVPLPSVLDRLSPVQPADYLELRSQRLALHPPERQGAVMASVASGTPCATAPHHEGCLAALAALTPSNPDGGWLTGVRPGDLATAEVLEILVYSRGDEVGALRNPDQVAAFLGTIDTLQEARLVLEAQGATLACTLDVPRSGYRRNGDGSWELLVVDSSCGGGTYARHRYLVAKDGATTLLAQDKALPQPECDRGR